MNSWAMQLKVILSHYQLMIYRI